MRWRRIVEHDAREGERRADAIPDRGQVCRQRELDSKTMHDLRRVRPVQGLERDSDCSAIVSVREVAERTNDSNVARGKAAGIRLSCAAQQGIAVHSVGRDMHTQARPQRDGRISR